MDANDDEVAHVAALALTEAAQRGSSPQVSQRPYRRSEQKSFPVQSWERMVVNYFPVCSSVSLFLLGALFFLKIMSFDFVNKHQYLNISLWQAL